MRSTTRSRAVLLATAHVARDLLALFQQPPLVEWKATVAEGAEHARFLAQIGACDVLLVDRDGVDRDLDTLAWLTCPPSVPVLFTSEVEPQIVRDALARRVHLWLPRSLLVDQPALLAEGLAHLRRVGASVGNGAPKGDETNCEARVERLADILWHALPIDGNTGWLSQRYLLERLHEEFVRAERHQTPFSLVLAELALDPTASHPSAKGLASVDVESALRSWTAERVLKGKRRSDVVGQYGPQGFMLLLPHTAEQGAKEVCRRLRHDFARGPWRVHTSFGVAGYAQPSTTPKGLLRLAEERLDGEREQHAH
jgi:diguanylate cyclase (GGDEF)-like protein